MWGGKKVLTIHCNRFVSEKNVWGENLLSIGNPAGKCLSNRGVLNKGFTLACMPFKMSIDLDLRARMVGTSSQNIMFLRKGDLGRQEIHKNHQQ